MADKPVALAQKKLMDVKLGQLPSWLGTRDFTPNGLLGSVRGGYERYYNKYINVKKGGIGGVAMFLAGYIALSYLWEYDHISGGSTTETHRTTRPLKSFVCSSVILTPLSVCDCCDQE
uniref:ATP synthase membrane subunit f n=1 Tax=Cyprinus carpio carpio TaxID=630221 RepID=A0A8C0YLV9_CYPCA